MPGSVNKVIIVGNLGKDPETRHTQDGNAIVNLNIATTESWQDKTTNERREKTEWHRVVIFNENLAKVAQNYLKKGSKVFLEGQLQTRKWTDQTGQEKFTTEVVLQRYRGELVMLDGRDGASSNQGSDYQAPYTQPNAGYGAASQSSSSSGFQGSTADIDDDIPF